MLRDVSRRLPAQCACYAKEIFVYHLSIHITLTLVWTNGQVVRRATSWIDFDAFGIINRQ